MGERTEATLLGACEQRAEGRGQRAELTPAVWVEAGCGAASVRACFLGAWARDRLPPSALGLGELWPSGRLGQGRA